MRPGVTIAVVAVGAVVLAAGVGAAVTAEQRAPHGAATTPDWLGEAPTSRVATMHLVAEADPIDRDVPADGRLLLVLRVTPRPGMRLYAHDATGYVPFTLRLDPVEGATVEAPAYPASTWYEFPPTRERSRVYQAAVTIRQAIVLSPSARRRLRAGGPMVLTAALRYQACDDRLCYRPTVARIAWTR